MNCRQILSASLLSALILLTSCGPTWPPYRYKLTVSVDEGGAIYSGSSVVEVRTVETSGLLQGSQINSSLKGQSTIVHLPNHRILLALLTGITATFESPIGDREWAGNPSRVLARCYGIKHTFEAPYSSDKYLSNQQGICHLSSNQFPTLITFENRDDPRTAMAVDPANPASTLGPDTRDVTATIEVVSDPITTGISKEFKWLRPHADNIGGDAPPGTRRLWVSSDMVYQGVK